MDAKELLRDWPDWSRANAARVLNSPAWRMAVRFGEAGATLTRLAALPSPAIVLAVRLDGTDHRLTLCPSPAFPDLWLLRERLAELPPEVVLALVEKECGVFLQFVEDTFRVSLAIAGLVPEAEQEPCARPVPTNFALATSAGDFSFSLDLTPDLELKLGSIDNLDATHEAIRSLTREASARYAEIALTDDEAEKLASGDFLLLPEGGAPAWTLDLPIGDAVQAVASEKGVLTFAQLADDALPPVPPAATLTLIRRGQILATAEPSRVGQAQALRILTRMTST